MSEQAGRYQRSTSGMIGAMIVLVAVVVGFVIFRDVNRNDPPSPVRAVDYASTARYAKQQADFAVLAPPSLPAGWRATTVEFTPEPDQHWHLGVLTDADRYIGLEQGDQPVRDMVKAYVDENAVRGGTVQVGGQEWTAYADPGNKEDGDQALVRRDGSTTTLVVGGVSQQVLAEYLATLR